MNRLPGLDHDIVARRSRLRRAALVLVAASMILVACGTGSDDDVPDDRQFANDPAPTREATEAPTREATPAVVDAPVGNVIATPADLLRTRGAPSTLYTVSGNQLYVVQVADKIEPTVLEMPGGVQLLGAAASPTGDRVGVVTSAGDDSPAQILFFDRTGELIGGPYGVVPSGTPGASPVATPAATPIGTPGATPATSDTGTAISVSWAPQGNGILVVDDNALVYVDVERGAEPISTQGIRGAIVGASASPTGGQILVHVVADDASHHAYLIQNDTGEINELWAMRTEPGMGLAEMAWLPTGNGVIFVRGELVDSQVMRGQLFSYEFSYDSPRLVATSGQGGPSASIRNVAVSADGRSVAYEVAIFDVDHWSTHSVWVRSLKHEGQGLQVPIDSGHTMSDLAWSSEGLVWSYTARYGPEGDFIGIIPPDGDAPEVIQIGVTGATPVASPMATPIGSPVATPAGPGV